MSQVFPAAAIPTYVLYGEAGDLPDVLHCEAIETRAALHDWNIRAHRHGRLHQVLLIGAEGGVAWLDGQRFDLKRPSLVNIPPGTIHGFAFERGTVGHVLTVPVEVIDAIGDPWTAAALAQPAALSPCERLRAIVAAIVDEHGAARAGRARMLKHWVGLLCGEIARRSAVPFAPNGRRADDLVRRFEVLVGQRFAERLRVSDYAAMLALSPTHLNRLVKAATGQSASALIEARAIREARRMLAYTILTVAEIGYQLGFQDPAHFSRVFSRATGASPTHYRRRIEAGGRSAQNDATASGSGEPLTGLHNRAIAPLPDRRRTGTVDRAGRRA